MNLSRLEARRSSSQTPVPKKFEPIFHIGVCMEDEMDQYIQERDRDVMPENVWRQYKHNASVILQHIETLKTCNSHFEKTATLNVINQLKYMQNNLLTMFTPKQ